MRSCGGGSRLKKVTQASEQQRPDVRQRRIWWHILQPSWSRQRLIFLDETGLNTKMARLYGWGPRCQRVVSRVPHGHWKTVTFLAGLTAQGVIAPLVVDGAINGDIFEGYIKQQLSPLLRQGDVVIMDNLSSHKREGVSLAIEACGAHVLYLPPYSPDLNPIELMFSKLKTLARKQALRTVETIENWLGRVPELFLPTECQNYMRHCGYTLR